MHFEEDSLALNSVGFDLGQAAEVISCHFTGTPIQSLVNAQFLLDFLNAVSVKEVELQLRDAEVPVVVTPVLETSSGVECLYVIMPIRV